MELHIANDLELDDEDDKKRLARVSVVEAITQAMNEVRDILAILGKETVQVTHQKESCPGPWCKSLASYAASGG